MLTDPLIHELLEFVHTLQRGQQTMTPVELASRLGCSIGTAEELLKTALKDELVQPLGDTFRLTEKGQMEIQRHREHYIHNRHAHSANFFGRAVRCLEGRIGNWNDHWKQRHGLDNHSLTDFYKEINDLQGRVEDLVSLVDLHQGGRGVVAVTLGGHRLITRLAEMGLTPGTEVTIVRSAPLHGPIEVSVRGVSLALGRGVASKIFVKKQGKQSFAK